MFHHFHSPNHIKEDNGCEFKNLKIYIKENTIEQNIEVHTNNEDINQKYIINNCIRLYIHNPVS